MDSLTLDKIFVLDNFSFVQDKKFFVRVDGRGNWYQWSTEGRRSTAEAEGFLPSATATATEGFWGRRPKVWIIHSNTLHFWTNEIFFLKLAYSSFEKCSISKSMISSKVSWPNHGRHYHLDPQVHPKIAKRHFFQDIQNSFQWATGIGLEPHQKKFSKKI